MKQTGVLLHISCLPNEFGVGTFGAEAYKFVDLLAELGFNLWQVLPLCPTDDANSPYNSPNPRDFNLLFLDLSVLYKKGLINKGELESQKVEHSFPLRLAFIERVFARAGVNPQVEAALQWHELKRYANGKGIKIIGDIPFYLSRESDEVARNPQFFNLGTQGGAPPDYFAKDGQAWSVPTYNWQAEGILDWWAERITSELVRYDYLRIDHFRGLVEYWEIPFKDKVGANGRWVNARPYEWFAEIQKKVDISKLIAEDLGSWSQSLENFINFTRIPNMKVLQFGFDGNPNNPHLPQHYPQNCVAYSGTHDNDTLVGFCDSVFKNYPPEQLAKEYIRQVFVSKAEKVIIQGQDLLFLGSEARMNVPGKIDAWGFRLNIDYEEKIDKNFFKGVNYEAHR